MNASQVYEPNFEIVSKNRRFGEPELYASSPRESVGQWLNKGFSTVLDYLPLCASPKITNAECVMADAECEGGYGV